MKNVSVWKKWYKRYTLRYIKNVFQTGAIHFFFINLIENFILTNCKVIFPIADSTYGKIYSKHTNIIYCIIIASFFTYVPLRINFDTF